MPRAERRRPAPVTLASRPSAAAPAGAARHGRIAPCPGVTETRSPQSRSKSSQRFTRALLEELQLLLRMRFSHPPPDPTALRLPHPHISRLCPCSIISERSLSRLSS
jgi:hypothetical protein